MVPHGRHRGARRGRVSVDHRSQEGPHRHLGGEERRPAADRERAPRDGDHRAGGRPGERAAIRLGAARPGARGARAPVRDPGDPGRADREPPPPPGDRRRLRAGRRRGAPRLRAVRADPALHAAAEGVLDRGRRADPHAQDPPPRRRGEAPRGDRVDVPGWAGGPVVIRPLAERPQILAGARTPFVRAFADLARVPAKELAAAAIREAVARSGLAPEDVDAVVVGNVAGPADAPNIARVASLLAGLPESAPAVTVNRNCASGLEAVIHAARLIELGEAEVVVAAGVESMSSIPLFFREEAREIFLAAGRAKSIPARAAILSRLRPRHVSPISGLEIGLTDPCCGLNMGETAEILAAEFQVPREAQDLFALQSHRDAVAAAPKHAEEIAPYFVPGALVAADVGPRPQQTLEALAKLRPVFDRHLGTVTAGNASPLTDGAAALVLATPARAARRARPAAPLGTLRASATVGLSPRRMGLGPAVAIPRALAAAGVTLADVDLFEINEAFAAQVIACLAALASERFCRDELGLPSLFGEIPRSRLNVNGGAVALGHPVGASGARLVLSILMEMRRRQAKLGVVSLCIGGGQGMAAVVEAP
ncbi:MAG: thiolase family protein [Acidobacteria bacterium]|nr:thiolase family protein [Acidobacteriota bacterium]